MRSLPFILSAVVALHACTSETSAGRAAGRPDTTAVENVSAGETGPKKPGDPNAQQFALPAMISDENLDEFFDEKTAKTLSEEQEAKLQLHRLEDNTGADYYLLGEFDLSDRFTTRLFLRNSDWTETVGWLANYDTNGKLTDHLEVFYSDNVEAYRSIASRISSGRITVTLDAYEYLGDEEKVTTTRTSYILDEKGRFRKE